MKKILPVLISHFSLPNCVSQGRGKVKSQFTNANMRGRDETIKEIVSLLNNYAGEIKTYAKFNWTDKHIHAEYFLKQFLFHVYGWKLKHVAEVKSRYNLCLLPVICFVLSVTIVI